MTVVTIVGITMTDAWEALSSTARIQSSMTHLTEQHR